MSIRSDYHQHNSRKGERPPQALKRTTNDKDTRFFFYLNVKEKPNIFVLFI